MASRYGARSSLLACTFTTTSQSLVSISLLEATSRATNFDVHKTSKPVPRSQFVNRQLPIQDHHAGTTRCNMLGKQPWSRELIQEYAFILGQIFGETRRVVGKTTRLKPKFWVTDELA
jgi:hypothetical protein